MEKKLILFLVYLFISIGLVTAQSRKVTGVVISSEDDLPIVGATILINGSSTGTVTDLDVTYSIHPCM